MKLLSRIKLINWHLFSHQTIDIKQNSLVSGVNGVGKSTFLDAIQYVITGGKAKFNTAANQQAKRDLEGYIRCKLGIENKTYLRPHDVTSHIALQFVDEETLSSVIIGVIIEINKSGRIYEHFYVLQNCEIYDELFIDNQVIRGYNSFKKNLLTEKIDFIFTDTKEKTRKLFLEVLEINNEKYTELIPKALAFRPIDELNKFVFDFLLNEKFVSIDDLRQNVRSYRELEKLIESLKDKETKLTEIENLYTELTNQVNKEELLKELADYIKYKKIEKEEKKLEEQITLIANSLQDTKNMEINLTLELEERQSVIDKLKLMLSRNETYQYLEQLEKDIKTRELRIEKLSQLSKDLTIIMKNEENLARFVYENFPNKELLNLDFNQIGNIDKIIYLYDEIKEKLLISISELKKEKALLNEKLNYITEEIKSLEKNQIPFPQNVIRLKELIHEEIKKLSHEKQYYCLCELIEIKDEAWRNALEGYLNTQRFDILIEPEYFDYALKVYEKHKDKEKIYGVGLVNTKGLDKYNVTTENSLASKLTYLNRDAKFYCNMLMDKVICVENVSDLKKHHSAITKSCMIYKNNTVRAINDDIYKRPYIGINAVKVQLENARNMHKDIVKKSDDCLKKLRTNEFYLERIKASQLAYIKQNYLVFQEIEVLNKELDILCQKRREVKENDVTDNMQKELSENLVLLKDIENKKNTCLVTQGKLLSDLENKKEKLKQISLDKMLNQKETDLLIIDYFADLLKKYQGNIEDVMNHTNREMKECEMNLQSIRDKLIMNMNKYNVCYHVGYSPSIDNIESYLNELNRIKNYELIKYQDQAKQARINCELIFREQFIYQLRENIIQAQDELLHLNNALKNKKFGGDEYEFIYTASNNPEYERYYNLILAEKDIFDYSLFQETINDQNRIILKELFDKLVIDNNDSEAMNTLQKFCDYRNYMSYDIKIHHKNGDKTYFSKVLKEKSGGETQTPFYVVIAASFEQLLNGNRKKRSPACFVMFDEAFNNMDESRIKAMMEFYQQLNIQLMIAVPPQRIETIIPHVNTTLIVMKDDNQSYIESFTSLKDLRENGFTE